MKTASEWGQAHGLAFYPGDPRDPPDGGEWGNQEDFIAAVQRDALEAAAVRAGKVAGKYAADNIRELKP